MKYIILITKELWTSISYAGAVIGCYESTRFKSKPKASKLTAVHILGLGEQPDALAAAVAAGSSIASGNFMTRFVTTILQISCRLQGQ